MAAKTLLRGQCPTSLELPLVNQNEAGIYLAALQYQCLDMLGFPGIYLKKLNSGNNIYARVRYQKLAQVYEKASLQAVIVPQAFPRTNVTPQDAIRMFQLRNFKYSIRETSSNAHHIESRQSSYTAKEAVYNESKHDVRGVPPLPVHASLTWRAQGVPAAVKVAVGVENLSTAILFRRKSDGSKFAHMPGTRTDSNIGFNISGHTDGSHLQPLESYAAMMNPRPPGVRMSLRHIGVHVLVETWCFLLCG